MQGTTAVQWIDGSLILAPGNVATVADLVRFCEEQRPRLVHLPIQSSLEVLHLTNAAENGQTAELVWEGRIAGQGTGRVCIGAHVPVARPAEPWSADLFVVCQPLWGVGSLPRGRCTDDGLPVHAYQKAERSVYERALRAQWWRAHAAEGRGDRLRDALYGDDREYQNKHRLLVHRFNELFGCDLPSSRWQRGCPCDPLVPLERPLAELDGEGGGFLLVEPGTSRNAATASLALFDDLPGAIATLFLCSASNRISAPAMRRTRSATHTVNWDGHQGTIGEALRACRQSLVSLPAPRRVVVLGLDAPHAPLLRALHAMCSETGVSSRWCVGQNLRCSFSGGREPLRLLGAAAHFVLGRAVDPAPCEVLPLVESRCRSVGGASSTRVRRVRVLVELSPGDQQCLRLAVGDKVGWSVTLARDGALWGAKLDGGAHISAVVNAMLGDAAEVGSGAALFAVASDPGRAALSKRIRACGFRNRCAVLSIKGNCVALHEAGVDVGGKRPTVYFLSPVAHALEMDVLAAARDLCGEPPQEARFYAIAAAAR